MKNIILPTFTFLFLTGCQSTSNSANDSWEGNCEQNYSLTGREKDNCLKKLSEDKKIDIKPGEVTIDPGNTQRESFDDIGKGGASDN